ncbi:MAG TPA: FAD-dependent monooxygenase [Casimicrobiaceae bacterium]|jgi:2-octaprenyl-6-methoxyphenol hydroxylase
MLHDLVIVGAGPVGATLALALRDADLDIAVLDSRAEGTPYRSDRSLALSHGARLILERLDIWPRLAATRDVVTPITSIDISQAGGFGTTQLMASDHDIPALGYVVSYRALQAALDAALARAGIAIRFDAAAKRVGGTPAYAAVTLVDERADPITARLAAIADGSGTLVDGIRRERKDYGHVAVTAKVSINRPHGGRAFERFTAEGPIALLPEGDRYGVVWTMAPERAQQVLALHDRAFLEALAACFGARFESFVNVSARRSFPLALEVARPAVATRVVVVGNAAQSLHPIAGQGFNLGMRDAFELALTIIATPRDALGEGPMLAAYSRRRLPDRLTGIALTHGLVQLFGTDLPFVRWPRGLALTLLDTVPAAKRVFARAMLFGVH